MTSNVFLQYPALPADYGAEILRVEVGSTLHGTGLPGSDDLDLMGVYVEHPESTIGLSSRPHYTWRSAPEGERSAHTDIDLTVYSLRKWCGLALNGNPTVLLILFAPEPDKVVINSPLGRELRAHADWFASKRSGKAFLGYMTQQRQRMIGERGSAGRIRRNLDGDVDWKYAMHLLRLGYQGIEFLETGRLTLPMPGVIGDHLRSVRRGEISFGGVIAESEALEAKVKSLLDGGSPLPDEPDRTAAEAFCVNAHLRTWMP